MNPYVLITAARNEERFIGITLDAVVQQTVKPVRWMIVSDGSTDRTDDIVAAFAEKHDFIKLVRREHGSGRDFGAKAMAFDMGYRLLKGVPHEYVGNLDSDVSFGTDFYEQILQCFEADSRLGLAGGVRYDLMGGSFQAVKAAENSVGGPFQTFRRQCFEDIGGYRALPCGGIDSVAETMARMHGWKVRSFPHIKAYHHRCTGTAETGYLRSRFKAGVRDYLLGYHPLFETLRIIRRSLEPPVIVGSSFWLSGFIWAAMKQMPRPVPDDFVRYLRSEQKRRMQGRA